MINETLIQAAALEVDRGVSVTPVDGDKRPTESWKPYQSEIMPYGQIQAKFGLEKVKGIARICGSVSGGLEVIDVDLKNDSNPDLLRSMLLTGIENAVPGLLSTLPIVRTRSGGLHIYYRCEVIEGNQKLARRLPSVEALAANPNAAPLTVIETRGEGGYVVAPPSPGYTAIQDVSIPIISIDQRDTLLGVCRSFNEVKDEKTPVKSGLRLINGVRPTVRDFLNPFDDYNIRGDVVALLVKHGWKIVFTTSKKTVMKRPGNSDSKTSGDFNHELGWFSVFSTNTIFEPNKAYLPCAVYAKLECGGDFKKAAKELLAAGYGQSIEKVREERKKLLVRDLDKILNRLLNPPPPDTPRPQ
jgi:hypothetical protein